MSDKILKLLVVVAFFAVISGSVAAAKTESEIESTITETLLQRHPSDNADWWRGLGPGTSKIIIRMYEGESSVYRRIRLLEGLRWFGDDKTVLAFIKKQVEKSSNVPLKTAALKAVGKAGGAKEVDYLGKYLKHQDARTRLAAAETLLEIDDKQARVLVEKFKTEEKAEWVVKKLNKKKKSGPPFGKSVR